MTTEIHMTVCSCRITNDSYRNTYIEPVTNLPNESLFQLSTVWHTDSSLNISLCTLSNLSSVQHQREWLTDQNSIGKITSAPSNFLFTVCRSNVLAYLHYIHIIENNSDVQTTVMAARQASRILHGRHPWFETAKGQIK